MSVPLPSSLQVSAPTVSTGGNSAIAPFTINFPSLSQPTKQTGLVVFGAIALAAVLLLRKR